MGCLFPQVAFDTGYKTANGKTEYFRMPYGSGDFVSVSLVRKYKPVSASAPIKRINGHTCLVDPVPQPCNNCVGCRLEKARQWKVRVCLEAKKYNPDDVHFITLTYDDQHLPINEYGQPYVNKRDFQLFMKRLRRYGGHFRFFACSEYGEIGLRPHFHAILFGRLADKRVVGLNQYSSDLLSLSWDKGIVQCSVAEPGCIAYVCGYVEKKQADPNYDSYPVKPFLMMSDHPGIGFDSVSSINLSYDPKVYGNFGGAHASSIPQALLRKMEKDPVFNDYKKRVKESGKASSLTLTAVYGTRSSCKIGDIRESLLLESFQKNRKDKL